MEDAQFETSKPSEILMGFPRYRRSHLKSETFCTLVRILSRCCDEAQLSDANQIHSASQELTNHNNGTDRMGRENQEKESEHLEITGTYFIDPNDPVTQKETQVFETFEGFRVQGMEFREDFMMVVEEDEGSTGRQDLMICESVEVMPVQANRLNKEQKLIDELNQIVQGTEKLGCDTNLTPSNLGLVEKQNGSSEFDLMDYQVGYAEFKQSDSKSSGTEIELQPEGEFNQHASGDSRASSITNILTSAQEQTSVPVISMSSIKRQQKEMELVQPVSAAMLSFPTTEEGEYESKEQHGQKVPKAMRFSVDQCMNSETLNLSIKHERQQKKMELVKPDCAATASLPTTKEGEFEKEKQHGQRVPDAIHFSADQGMNNEVLDLSTKHERQQKEMELMKSICAAMVSLPAAKEGEYEKEEQHGRKVPETIDFSVDHGKNSEALNLDEYGGEKMSLLETDILEAKHAMQHEGEHPEKISCANDATIFFNNQNKEVDFEEGEISGDFGIDDNSFSMSFADSLMLQQRKDEDQNPENVVENTVFPINKWNGEKENYEPTSFMVHAPQDACNSGQVEPRTGNKNGFPSGVDIGISREVINYGEVVEHGCVLERGNNEDKYSGINEAVNSLVTSASNQVLHRGFLEDATENHQNASAVKKAGVNCKKKHGPVTEEKKAKKKEKKRKKRAENNRKLGVKRLKLHPVQKPKTVTYCRHYLKGRCHEGDKCKFSHDIVPLTKSKPCCHFARHSCMKGDDCPFDHQLSKYPCSNFLTRGSCCRGDACLFSHQMPTKQDISTSSNDSRPELKTQLLSGITKLSKPLNISGSSASQQKCLSDSKGIQSHINSDHEVADTLQKPTAPAPKGISFINVSKSSSLNPSTPKQDIVTRKKESVVQIGTLTDQSASVTAQNLEDPKKMPLVVPKGINFLSFGKGHVSSIKSSICSLLNKESGVNFSKVDNFGSPELASSSLYKDVCSKIGDRTKQSVLHTAPHSIEILKKNQSIDKGMNLDFSGKVSIDCSVNDVQCSLTSHHDRSLSRSVQEGVKSYASKTSTMTSSMLPASEHVASGHHKHIFNSVQKTLLSTLSFAAKHGSDIKMKCSAGASTMRSEVTKNISNSSP